jgi:hypothetical protein
MQSTVLRPRSFSRWALGLLALALFAGASCQGPGQAQPDYRLNATVRDIMQSMVDPSADVVWNSVATIQDASGTEEREPKTDDQWNTVRHHALIVAEATNLLLMPGRKMAKPGERSSNPEVELHPEEIEALVNQDRKVWLDFAHGLNDQMTIALRAVEAKDVKALFDVGEAIDTACEHCHRHYWYPPDAETRKR